MCGFLMSIVNVPKKSLLRGVRIAEDKERFILWEGIGESYHAFAILLWYLSLDCCNILKFFR